LRRTTAGQKFGHDAAATPAGGYGFDGNMTGLLG